MKEMYKNTTGLAKHHFMKTRSFFGNIVYKIDAKTDPAFGAKMHIWTRRLARIMLWFAIPATIIILAGVAGMGGKVDGKYVWVFDQAFKNTAVITSSVIGGMTAFMHILWFWFSKFQLTKKTK